MRLLVEACVCLLQSNRVEAQAIAWRPSRNRVEAHSQQAPPHSIKMPSVFSDIQS